jgi:hypothetical protein
MANKPQTLCAGGFTRRTRCVIPDRYQQLPAHRARFQRKGGLTRDDILDNITLYWLTGTAVSSARLYWENKLALRREERNYPGRGQRLSRRSTLHHGAGPNAPSRKLIHFNKLARRPLAAWEQPPRLPKTRAARPPKRTAVIINLIALI